MPALPTLAEMESALELIRPHLWETPVQRWPLLEEDLGCGLWIKHENHTPVGAFKVRGGLVYLDTLTRAHPRTRGVIAASTGNHGQSIAFAARQYGLRVCIAVPLGNNPEKNAAMRALGAEVLEHGADFQEALEFAGEYARREGLHAVPSFHPWLVRGVATYGLELFRAVRELDAVFVPIGLGSGFCGMAAARQALGRDCKLVGVVSEHAPAYAHSFRDGRLREHASSTRVAEGVACRKPDPGALAHVLAHAHEVVQVSDAEALAAMNVLLRATHNLAEGAGALAYAALRKRAAAWEGKRVACILSGGNARMELVRAALDPGETAGLLARDMAPGKAGAQLA